MARRTISESEFEAIFYPVGRTYRISPKSLASTYFHGWPTAESLFSELDDHSQHFNVRAEKVTFKSGDLLLLLGHEKRIQPDGWPMVIWHVFHLGLQKNMWILENIEPLEPTLLDKIRQATDNDYSFP